VHWLYKKVFDGMDLFGKYKDYCSPAANKYCILISLKRSCLWTLTDW